MPMVFDSMALIEGKLRLPMLRGEHSPAYQHFRTMEECMAKDLNHWLCNIYIEIRHLSLTELGATEAMLKVLSTILCTIYYTNHYLLYMIYELLTIIYELLTIIYEL
jgi:hypothetical protein